MKRTALLLLFCLLLTSCAAPQTGAPSLTLPDTVPYTFGETEPSATEPGAPSSATDPHAYEGLSPYHPAREAGRTDETCDHWNQCTHSYVDDETCLRSCVFCEDKTFPHCTYEDLSVSGLSCLWVKRCIFCKEEIGEGMFKHRYGGYAVFTDGQSHTYYCMFQHCKHTLAESHQWSKSVFHRDGMLFDYCKLCGTYAVTDKVAEVSDSCQVHDFVGVPVAAWYQEAKWEMYPCKECLRLFTPEEYGAEKAK